MVSDGGFSSPIRLPATLPLRESPSQNRRLAPAGLCPLPRVTLPPRYSARSRFHSAARCVFLPPLPPAPPPTSSFFFLIIYLPTSASGPLSPPAELTSSSPYPVREKQSYAGGRVLLGYLGVFGANGLKNMALLRGRLLTSEGNDVYLDLEGFAIGVKRELNLLSRNFNLSAPDSWVPSMVKTWL